MWTKEKPNQLGYYWLFTDNEVKSKEMYLTVHEPYLVNVTEKHIWFIEGGWLGFDELDDFYFTKTVTPPLPDTKDL